MVLLLCLLCQPGLQSSEGLTGAGGYTSKVSHLVPAGR